MKNKYQALISASTDFLSCLLKHALILVMYGGIALMYYHAGKVGLFDDFAKKECVQMDDEFKLASRNINEVTDEE